MQGSDAILLAGVFGDDAARVARIVEARKLAVPIEGVSVSSDLAARLLERSARQTGSTAIASELHARAEGYWQGRGQDNLVHLFEWVLGDEAARKALPAPMPIAPVRFSPRKGTAKAPLVVILDYETGDQAGDRDTHAALCAALVAQHLACQSLFADWGAPTVAALEQLKARQPAALVSLADFALGGSDRDQATRAITQLGVPLLKAIRIDDLDENQWRRSVEGLPSKSVYYRVAMPELSGASQPSVLAVAAAPRVDPVSGIEIRLTRPIGSEIDAAARRLAGWVKLQTKPNAQKHVAIIYYNHPPGRHNIGADNLDVPASLLTILQRLKTAGYSTGPLPADSAALLHLLQDHGVNMPGDAKALRHIARASALHLPLADYQAWFQRLPDRVRDEMIGGPLSALAVDVREALATHDTKAASATVDRVLKDLDFVIEGTPGEIGRKAQGLSARLRAAYDRRIAGKADTAETDALTRELEALSVEGVEGWGPPPGKVMTLDGQFVFPALRFGNVLVGPQPPRGWETDEALLHANRSVPPPHQYLAFYQALRQSFAPDAIVHLGRHSTYEFLPGAQTGLARDSYSRLVADDIPGLYPYIVDGVGEGLQAKRRGLAVIIDHLTPPLAATPLYDDLLGLRQLVESYESADSSADGETARHRALERIRASVRKLGMDDAIIAEIRSERGGEAIAFERIDPDLLVHETGHMLTRMQEDFMPMGLHVFGRTWSDAAVRTMLRSMGKPDAEAALRASPEAEMQALLTGLDGRFIAPGPGNDPLRSPESLPTGRNFTGIDASLVPDRIAWDIGSAMARKPSPTKGGRAVVLWASDTVRDGGVTMAFGLSLLHVEPVWNSRGILTGLKRLPADAKAPREDVTFVASGLFRDLYGEQLKWLDKASLLALDGASLTIRKAHPELGTALDAALAPLGELRAPGRESLAANRLAAAWVAAMQKDKAADGRTAALRVFAPAPGEYGAGVNRLAERSGSWSDRNAIARVYQGRVGHAYGVDLDGAPEPQAFRERLAGVSQTFLGRSSNLYGLVDNNDAFDYLGGLNLAVEKAGGRTPDAYVIDASNPKAPDMAPLKVAILSELRARQLNPAWIKSLMPHGYAGARTMNFAFFENLWGWEVTDPNLVPDAIWDDVYATYVKDRHGIGVEKFLDQPDNRPVKANMLAVMLVAAQKGYWKADDATLADLAHQFVTTIARAGLPGSGHTSPDHPMFGWVRTKLSKVDAKALDGVLAAARGQAASTSGKARAPSLHEVRPAQHLTEAATSPTALLALAALLFVLFLAGLAWSRRTPR
nr:cobaltochelatase subunit CobN [Novosphingobium profundi]